MFKASPFGLAFCVDVRIRFSYNHYIRIIMESQCADSIYGVSRFEEGKMKRESDGSP